MTDQFIGKVLAEKYRIDSLLSENEPRNLYRGTHVSMGKPVSIKILSPMLASDENHVKRFADEARTVSRISHPNILNVTDYGSDKDKAIFIIYDEASGETLKDTLKRDGKFSLERANNIIRQIASGLNAAHASGIIHQNLTSENILIKETENSSDEVKILNFGTAQPLKDAAETDKQKSQSDEYFSPEHYGLGKIDERSDVYSLGIIAYEMLAGEVPFKTDNSIIVLGKKKDQPPPPLSAYRKDLPPEVEQVLLTALAINPEARYQTARDFADAFNDAAKLGLVNQPLNAPAGVIVKEAPQNNIWKTAFIVLAGISLLGAFFIYTTQTKQTDPATQLVTDANGIPVQPVNPATGTTEQSMSNMNTFNPEMFSNINSATMTQMPPGTTTVAPGGDGYDPWATGKPPAGAPPTYVGPGGQQVYVDGNGSIFMPSDNNTYIMVPKNANAASNVNTQVRGKNSNTNTNTATAPANTSVKPPANTATNTANPQAKPSPNTKPSPAKPSPSPKKAATPSAGGNRPPSGTMQDSD